MKKFTIYVEKNSISVRIRVLHFRCAVYRTDPDPGFYDQFGKKKGLDFFTVLVTICIKNIEIVFPGSSEHH